MKINENKIDNNFSQSIQFFNLTFNYILLSCPQLPRVSHTVVYIYIYIYIYITVLYMT